MIRTRRLSASFLLALALLTFLLFVGRRDIVTSHEARVVQVAREMAASGWPWNAVSVAVPQTELVRIDGVQTLRPRADGSTMSVNPWLVPVMNGQIRLQKPPLPYWCTAILYRIGGESPTTARLLPALMGAIAVLLAWDLARLLFGRMCAWYAALVWISSYFIVDEYRKVMADPYLAFFTLAALWAWIRASSRGAPHHRSGLLMAYLAMALGILAKGPIIFVFMLVILPAFHLCFRRRLPGGITVHLLGVGLLLLVALPWYIAILVCVDRVAELWRYESLGALSDKVDDMRPPMYYLPQLLLISLPWTIVWLLGMIQPVVRFSRRRLFPVVSLALIVAIFSLAREKKNAYLLPMTPLQTLVIAQGLSWLTVIARRRWRNITLHAGQAALTLVAVMLALGVQIFLSTFRADSDNRRSPRQACAQIMRILQSSPHTSLLSSRIQAEPSVYFPLHMSDAADSDDVLVVLDNRHDDAEQEARLITSTASGPVTSVEPVDVPDALSGRWKVFRLCIHQSNVPRQARESSSTNTWESSLLE